MLTWQWQVQSYIATTCTNGVECFCIRRGPCAELLTRVFKRMVFSTVIVCCLFGPTHHNRFPWDSGFAASRSYLVLWIPCICQLQLYFESIVADWLHLDCWEDKREKQFKQANLFVKVIWQYRVKGNVFGCVCLRLKRSFQRHELSGHAILLLTWEQFVFPTCLVIFIRRSQNGSDLLTHTCSLVTFKNLPVFYEIAPVAHYHFRKFLLCGRKSSCRIQRYSHRPLK